MIKPVPYLLRSLLPREAVGAVPFHVFFSTARFVDLGHSPVLDFQLTLEQRAELRLR